MISLSAFPAALAVIFAAVAHAQSPAWGQCGGIGWTGSTSCIAGYTCTLNNAYYSQCLPNTGTTTSTPTGTPTSIPTSTTTVTTSVSSTGTTTSTSPSPTGSQIRAVTDPVYHFYLQSNEGTPMLGPEDSGAYFNIGDTISIVGSSPTLYLNVNTSVSTSYMPLSFATTATTTDWALEGDTIITSNPRELNFIACATTDANFYTLYLQEGNDTPAGETCTLQTIHLPCLC